MERRERVRSPSYRFLMASSVVGNLPTGRSPRIIVIRRLFKSRRRGEKNFWKVCTQTARLSGILTACPKITAKVRMARGPKSPDYADFIITRVHHCAGRSEGVEGEFLTNSVGKNRWCLAWLVILY